MDVASVRCTNSRSGWIHLPRIAQGAPTRGSRPVGADHDLWGRVKTCGGGHCITHSTLSWCFRRVSRVSVAPTFSARLMWGLTGGLLEPAVVSEVRDRFFKCLLDKSSSS